MKNKKVSDGMKKCHAEGRHPGWRHINEDKNRRSYPEKFFRKVLNNNGLFDKYTIYEKLPIGKYFLDFAIIELKLDIEIDGEQHFRNDEVIKHDDIRNKFLIDKGWKVYRIAWTELYGSPKEHIKKFLEYVSDVHNRSSEFYDVAEVLLKRKIFCVDCGIELKYKNKQMVCKKCNGLRSRKVERPNKEELERMIKETSVLAVGRKFGVSDNAVRKWLR